MCIVKVSAVDMCTVNRQAVYRVLGMLCRKHAVHVRAAPDVARSG
jgi:hypothetical protein